MKLTKSQRLFVAIGKLNSRIASESDLLHILRRHVRLAEEERFLENKRQKMKQLRARRKKLIREALRAYELEIGDAFSAGVALARACENSDAPDAPMVIEDEGQTIIF
jgi:hypothetical protein